MEKRFQYKDSPIYFSLIDKETGRTLCAMDCCILLNELHEENQRLKSENIGLKITVGRNEAYIKRMKGGGTYH